MSQLCSDSRFRKHVEHGDAFWGLGRIQVIQSGHCVDDSKHDSCFDPVIHQVEVSQAHWKQSSQCIVILIITTWLIWLICNNKKQTNTKVHIQGGGTDLEPSPRGASAASCRWGWWGCTWSGRGRPPRGWLPGKWHPAHWCSTSPAPSWSGPTCWPAGGSRHTSFLQKPPRFSAAAHREQAEIVVDEEIHAWMFPGYWVMNTAVGIYFVFPSVSSKILSLL